MGRRLVSGWVPWGTADPGASHGLWHEAVQSLSLYVHITLLSVNTPYYILQCPAHFINMFIFTVYEYFSPGLMDNNGPSSGFLQYSQYSVPTWLIWTCCTIASQAKCYLIVRDDTMHLVWQILVSRAELLFGLPFKDNRNKALPQGYTLMSLNVIDDK